MWAPSHVAVPVCSSCPRTPAGSSALRSAREAWRLRRSEESRRAAAAAALLSASSVTFLRDRRLKSSRLRCRARGLGAVYDAAEVEEFFGQRPFLVLGRLLKVLTGVSKCAFLAFSKDAEIERRLARRVRELFTELGPTYIKLGQALSVRPDVLPEAFLQEFREFQDSVTPFDNEEAVKLVLRELKCSQLSELFSDFSAQPVAAASLGQVYKARLKNGQSVAVKVQRPNLAEKVALDLVLARQVAKWLVYFEEFFPGVQGNDLVGFVDAFGQRLFEELDYEMEVKNAQRFRELYGDQEKLKVPTMYPSLATGKVIVMEWIDGVKLTDTHAIRSLGLEPLDYISVGIECAMRQLLEHGFFHADPHPGNFFVTAKGELCVLDFGMMSEMPKEARLAVIQHIVHVVNRDYGGMAQDYNHLGFISEEIDPRPIVPQIRAYFEPRMSTKAAAAVSFKTIIDGLEEVIFKNYPFSVPPFYALVVRSLVTLEGLALSIDPKYRVLAAAYPYLAKRVLLDSELRSSLFELLINTATAQPAQPDARRFRWDRAIDLLRESSKSSVAVGATSRTPSGKADDMGPYLDLASSLIEDAAFRQTLVAELASTADVMIADIIGGAMSGSDAQQLQKLRKRLGLQLDDEARVSDVRETVNLIAEKVADRIPNGMDAVNLAMQAAAGAVQASMFPEPGKNSDAERGADKKAAPSFPEVAGEFFDQLGERAAVRTLKALANWIGEDQGDASRANPSAKTSRG